MTPVAAAPTGKTNLVTLKGIPIADVGEWQCATGTTDFTDDMLADWVAAAADPGIGSPRLKRGHFDPRFKDDASKDGEPLLGLATNLRIEDDGMLYADFAGLDPAFAEALPFRYPARSIEAKRNVTSAVTGKTYATALHALALIPDEGAVDTLPDLPVPECMVGCETIAASKMIAASWNPDDVRRAWDAANNSPGSSEPYKWVEQIELDPNTVIVCEGSDYYRIPFTLSGGEVFFDTQGRVEVERAYVPKSESDQGDAQIAASRRPVWRRDPRSETRPEPNNKETSMDPKMLRASLGLAEDASDEDVRVKLAEAGVTPKAADPNEPPKPEGDNPDPDDGATDDEGLEGKKPEGVKVPEGMSLVDTATLDTLKEQGAIAASLKEDKDAAERDSFLDDAIMAGKFPEHRRDHYVTAWTADAEGTRGLIDALTPGLIPVDGERGIAAGKKAHGHDASVQDIADAFGVPNLATQGASA